ncbi:MAG: efflux RND transporter periplasmic adaptor subunit [Pseudoalteromonas distincta]|uniref:efflux RND transporter periplasmic adaptor subunit n=1 Tax=Pseudoalteromonas distincta TaxID=77608 RepID=UPI003F9937AE
MSNLNKSSAISIKVVVPLCLLGAAAVAVAGVYSRHIDSQEVADWTAQQMLPTVSVTRPELMQTSKPLTLAGRIAADKQAVLHARVDGYIKDWHHDLGSFVNKGELLAELDTPSLDEQFLQAEADLRRAESNLKMARTTAERWQKLSSTHAVTIQDVEQRETSLLAAKADLDVAKALLRKLQVEKSLARIVAPFSGVITARNKDIGDLINAGSDDDQALFTLAQTDYVRVSIDVPQKYAKQVVKGAEAFINVPEYHERHFIGHMSVINGAVNSKTGTVRMQLRVDNSDNALLPGGYAQVEIPLTNDASTLTLPASAIIFNADGLSVATSDENGLVLVKPIKVLRDLGRIIEISQGLSESDSVIVNPPDGVIDGDKVIVIQNENS